MDDLAARIGEIARTILGEPNPRRSTREQLRFGSNGSVAVEIAGAESGTWFDFESETGGGARELIRVKGGIAEPDIPAWLEQHLGIAAQRRPRADRRIVASYDYRDEAGAVRYQVVRYQPKDFRQRRPDGKGRWIWGLGKASPLLYRLPELIAAPAASRVYITEGEKDADRLAGLGAVATTNSGGAGKWSPDFGRWFAGRRVCILPDNDAAGGVHAARVAAALAGVAAEVRVLALPGLPEKGDCSDWLDAGGTLARLDGLADQARLFEAGAAAAPPDGGGPQEDRPLIRPAAPFDTARQFIELQCCRDGLAILRHHLGEFFEWQGVVHRRVAEADMRARLYGFLDTCNARGARGVAPVEPTARLVGDTLDALRAAAHLPSDLAPPAWVAEAADLDPAGIVVCQNGLLHLPTLELLPSTPAYFALNAVDFPFRPDAPEPVEWLRFLDELWPGDAAAVALLQEFFGLCLTSDTSQQKALMIVGPKRSGKGTIGRVLTALVGAASVVHPTLAAFGNNFGLSPLIGKRLAVISDARLGGGVPGQQQAITENLLSIIGEDEKTIDRKYLSHWTGRLQTRFLVLTNELPRLADASGALASRFLLLVLTESFYGREDQALARRLLAALPGIFNWALVGWRRLSRRGYFVQPASGADAVTQLEELGSPISAFLNECAEVGRGLGVADGFAGEVREVFAAWSGWCREGGRRDAGRAEMFSRDLRAALPHVRLVRPRTEGGKDRPRIFVGLRLNERGRELAMAHQNRQSGLF